MYQKYLLPQKVPVNKIILLMLKKYKFGNIASYLNTYDTEKPSGSNNVFSFSALIKNV